MITFHPADDRRESWICGGWNLADDDCPRIPEPDPMSSAQARRFWKQSTPASGLQCDSHGR
jgi:hypothetical protein